MGIITVSREYGAGGGEVARQLAETLGWELLDRELLHQAAELEHLPDHELDNLDEKARFRLHPPHEHYLRGLKEAARRAANRGNVILVGRGSRHLLAETASALHLYLLAPREWRARRMAGIEGWPVEQALAECLRVDRSRERFTRYFFGANAFHPAQFDLIVNAGRVPLAEVVACVATIVRADWGQGAQAAREGERVLTLSRELGAGDTGFGPTLGQRLGLRVYDREFLEQEAIRLGVAEADLEKIDEQPARLFERFRQGSLHQRYIEALDRLMKELAARGDVLLVGRGGSAVLRDDRRAFHVRLVATMEVRLRRVMEHRWLRERQARELIAKNDTQRRSYYEHYFAADWTNPLEYHLTVNSGRLGPVAVDVVAFMAERHWTRQE